MSDTIVKIEHLSHKYSKAWAIQDINLEINQRGVIGLLGSNGAGKSTTMNILCGVLNQTEGKVLVDGIDMKAYPLEAKRLIGFLPQTPPLHFDLTVDEYLIHCAHLRLMDRKKISSALATVKERCGIAHFSNRLIKNLSGGYRQRVGIAQAIIHTPKLVVMDEPTNGLDPNQITGVRSLIREIAEERSVIFSSHILSEIEATCKHVKMIENGRMVFSDTMDAFNNYIKPATLVVTLEAAPDTRELELIPGITKAENVSSRVFRLHFDESAGISEKVVNVSVEKGWRLSEINLERSSLDAIFAKLSSKSFNN